MNKLVIDAPPKSEASLLVLLLEEVVPRFIGNPLLALALDTVAPIVSVQGGTSEATLRFGDGEVKLENGTAADAWLHVHGDIDAFLGVATGEDPVRPILGGRVRVSPRLVPPTEVIGVVRRVARLPLSMFENTQGAQQ